MSSAKHNQHNQCRLAEDAALENAVTRYDSVGDIQP
jgi:hypothetical protein